MYDPQTTPPVRRTGVAGESDGALTNAGSARDDEGSS